MIVESLLSQFFTVRHTLYADTPNYKYNMGVGGRGNGILNEKYIKQWKHWKWHSFGEVCSYKIHRHISVSESWDKWWDI